jgi:metal-responsive CopG/Arc/MetJ family transcriptional regulator
MISEMKRWNLFIPVNLLEKTQNLAKKRGVSSADVVRIALEKYLLAVEKQEKAALEAENVAA